MAFLTINRVVRIAGTTAGYTYACEVDEVMVTPPPVYR